MSRRDDQSGDLFAYPTPPRHVDGSMDYRAVVGDCLGVMLANAHKAGLDRHEVAARASRLSGKDVTKNMLDGYTSTAREEFNCPLWLAPVLEVVCESTDLAVWHGAVHGGQLMVGVATIDAEIGRILREREKSDARLRGLKELRRRAG